MFTLRQLFTEIREDRPGLSLIGFATRFLIEPAFRILLNHRLGKYFYYRKDRVSKFIARRYRYVLITKRGCDFSYNAKLGKNLSFPHPLGIVIGDGVIVKDNVKIWHNVTLGSHGKKGQALKYPILESGVKIYTGATVIGGVTVGKNAIIGANTLVNIDVPAGALAVGVPCRIVKQ